MPSSAAGEGEVLIRISACGVCRTDLHIIDGEEFLPLAAEISIRPAVHAMPLVEANAALAMLRAGAVSGAIALTM